MDKVLQNSPVQAGWNSERIQRFHLSFCTFDPVFLKFDGFPKSYYKQDDETRVMNPTMGFVKFPFNREGERKNF